MKNLTSTWVFVFTAIVLVALVAATPALSSGSGSSSVLRVDASVTGEVIAAFPGNSPDTIKAASLGQQQNSSDSDDKKGTRPDKAVPPGQAKDKGVPSTTTTTSVTLSSTTTTTTSETTTTAAQTTTSSSTTTTRPLTTTTTTAATTTSSSTTTTRPLTTTTTTAATTTSSSTTTTRPLTTTTTTAPTTTTALPAGTVVWQPNIATSGARAWDSIAISGKADVVWGGGDTLALWNYDVDGSHNAGVRLGWQNRSGTDQPDGPYNLPKRATYSLEMLIPVSFDGESNVFQFKTRSREHGQRVMLTKVSLDWNGSGYDAKLGTRVRSDGAWRRGAPDTLRDAATSIVAGQWFTITVDHTFGKDGTGRHILYINGSRVWDVAMSTEANNLDEYDHPKEWAINHYLGSWQAAVTPADSSIEIRNLIVKTK